MNNFSEKPWKKIAVFFLVLASTIFLFPNVHHVIAQEQVQQGVDILTATGMTQTDPRIIVARIIRVMLGLLGTLLMSLIIYAGYLWTTAAGNEESIAKAKEIMKNAVIGLLIILSALAITTYILNLLLKATGMISDADAGVGFAGRGALGAGVIRSHYPSRNQIDVSRNTNIIITFRVPMSVNSFATWDGNTDDKDGDGVERDWNDVWTLKTDAIKIVQPKNQSLPAYASRLYFVQGEFANDEQVLTLVIDPNEYLGSATDDVVHQVTLGSDIMTYAKPSGPTPFLVPYIWEFTTNTELDFTPPHVVGMDSFGYKSTVNSVVAVPGEKLTQAGDSNGDGKNDYVGVLDQNRKYAGIIPFVSQTTNSSGTREICDTPLHTLGACEQWPRNVLIQVNFNEAVNPITVVGRDAQMNVYRYKGTTTDLFPSDWEKIAGEWRVSTDYRTLEFFVDAVPLPSLTPSSVPSGANWTRNSCGDVVVFLPENSSIRTFIKTATPKNNDPTSDSYSPQVANPGNWDGVVDVSDNVFDGNGDSWATATSNIFPSDTPNYPESPISGQDFDDFIFLFDTSDKIDLKPPIVLRSSPFDGSENVGAGKEGFYKGAFELEMSKFISATSMTPNLTNYLWARKQSVAPDWETCTDDANCEYQGLLLNHISNTLVDFDETANTPPYDHSLVKLFHEELGIDPKTDYIAITTKGMKDIFQNCYSGGCCDSDDPKCTQVDKEEPAKTPYSTYNPNTDSVGKACAYYENNPL